VSTSPQVIAAASNATAVLRLKMAPRVVHANSIDGAWWPRSTDLIAELPQLLAALATRLGRIRGVLLNQGEWAPTPVDWTPPGNHRVRIGWYGHQDAHMAVIIGDSVKRVDLLVIPPDADPVSASAAMALAASTGNTLSGPEALRAAGLPAGASDDNSGANNASLH
jgi:Family of unknown function (DUF5994)